jgi:hypothetical protein
MRRLLLLHAMKDTPATNDNTVPASAAEQRALLSGRVAVLYASSQYFLALPFAAQCMAAVIAHEPVILWLAVAPFVLQIATTIIGNRLKAAYDRRAPGDDPAIWLRRYMILSGVDGATWGFGAVIWFVPGAFHEQAYLCLGFLGMTVTEFLVRSAYRPAYLLHAAISLGPLAVLLFLEGSTHAMLTSVLVLFFAGVLYSYCEVIGNLIDESVLLRHDNPQIVVRPSHKKHHAATRHERRTPRNTLLGMAQLFARGKPGQTRRD